MDFKADQLDDLDFQILERLQAQARATWTELSQDLGLTAPAIAERARKLEERGIITGYAALLEPERVGCGLLAFITVQLFDTKGRKAFLERINAMPEVLECHHVTGEHDYWLKVRCRDTRDLERIITDEFKGHAKTMRTRTTVVLSSLKDSPRLPLRRP